MTPSKERPIRLVVSGCCGRMGSLIIEEALKEPGYFELEAGVEQAGHPQAGKPVPGWGKPVETDLERALARADLLIEFTTPEASVSHARAAADGKIPILIGTTGFTPDQMEELKRIAHRIPVFWSPNLSIGIVIVRQAIGAISQLLLGFGLAERTQVGISETHHTAKKDKPSGTAKALAQELLKTTGWLIRDEEIEARREGDVIGVHSVTFRCPSENITLTHEATDRRVFAQGALLVARSFRQFGKKPGFYTMDDFVETHP